MSTRSSVGPQHPFAAGAGVATATATASAVLVERHASSSTWTGGCGRHALRLGYDREAVEAIVGGHWSRVLRQSPPVDVA